MTSEMLRSVMPRDLSREAALIAARSQRDRQSLERVWRASRRERLSLALVFALVGASAAFFLPFERDATLLRAGVVVFTVGLCGVALRGAARARAELRGPLDRCEARCAARPRVRVFEASVSRVLTATDEGGEGLSWWFFIGPDGSALLVEDAELSVERPAQWRASLTLVVDGMGEGLFVETTGAPVPFSNRAWQPPDFLPQPDSLYWTAGESEGEGEGEGEGDRVATPCRIPAATLPDEAGQGPLHT
jgi:hypothetical protein